MTDSRNLLAQYIETGSEAAFRELVTRYLNLVYSTALRLVSGDAHLAQDVAQTVFIDLARKAKDLSPKVLLGGWLHQRAFHVATTAVRGVRRRQHRERKAAEMNTTNDHPSDNLTQASAVLDAAITELGDADRMAVLLRFFEQRDFRSVGEALGTNEDAARMRVTRALEKLHLLLKARGIALSGAALGALLTAEAATATPVGLATSISAAALAATSAGTGITLSLMKILTMTKLKAGIFAGLIVAGVGTPVVLQQQAQSQLRQSRELLQQQSAQLAQLAAENELLSNLTAQSQAPLPDSQMSELLRLRGEVGQLRKQGDDLARLRAENQRLQASLPKNAPRPDTQQTLEEQQKSLAIAKLSDAKLVMLGFFRFANDNDNRFPTTLDQVKPYLDGASTEWAFTQTNQFEIVYQGSIRDISNPATIVVLREEQAWPTPYGTWARSYGFADGHSEVHTEPVNDFRVWESKHLAGTAGSQTLGGAGTRASNPRF